MFAAKHPVPQYLRREFLTLGAAAQVPYIVVPSPKGQDNQLLIGDRRWLIMARVVNLRAGYACVGTSKTRAGIGMTRRTEDLHYYRVDKQVSRMSLKPKTKVRLSPTSSDTSKTGPPMLRMVGVELTLYRAFRVLSSQPSNVITLLSLFHSHTRRRS